MKNGNSRSATLPPNNTNPRRDISGGRSPQHLQYPPQPYMMDTRSLQRPRSMPYPQPTPQERSTLSLPRSAYDRHRGPGDMQPDFYFMPSQRKYSGEVVRVYVDYNKMPK